MWRIAVVDRISRALWWAYPGDQLTRPRVWWGVIATGVVAATLLIVRMFVPRVVGMADGGEGFDLLCSAGLADDRAFGSSGTGFIAPSWHDQTWYGETCAPSSEVPAWSVYYLYVALSRAIGALLGTGFDTRVLGTLLALSAAALLAALVRYLPGSIGFRLAVTAAVLALLADGVFTGFFISPGSTGVQLVAVLAALVALLIIWGGYADRSTALDVAPRGTVARILGALLAFATLSVSPVMLVFLPDFVVGFLMMARMREEHEHGGRIVGRQLPGDRRRQRIRRLTLSLPGLAMVGILLVAAVGQLLFLSSADRREHHYDTLFLSILPGSPTPAEDIEWFGLPPSAAEAIGQPIGSAAATQQLDSDSLAAIDEVTFLRFWVTHAVRIVAQADQGLSALARPELTDRGSYLEDSGEEPGAKERRWAPVVFLSDVAYAIPLLIPALQITVGLLSLALGLARNLPLRSRGFGWAVFFLLVSSAAYFWLCILGDTTRLSESLLPATLVLALTGPLGAACAMVRLAGGQAGRKSLWREPSAKNSRTPATIRSAARPSP